MSEDKRHSQSLLPSNVLHRTSSSGHKSRRRSHHHHRRTGVVSNDMEQSLPTQDTPAEALTYLNNTNAKAKPVKNILKNGERGLQVNIRPSSEDRRDEKPILVTFTEQHISDWRDPEFFMTIERDFSGKFTHPTNIRFQSTFPLELKGAVDESVFVNTMNTINEVFAKGEAMTCGNVMISIGACLTCQLIHMCWTPPLDKANEKVQEFLYKENDLIYHPIGLHIAHPMARGLRRIIIRSILNYGLYDTKTGEEDNNNNK